MTLSFRSVPSCLTLAAALGAALITQPAAAQVDVSERPAPPVAPPERDSSSEAVAPRHSTGTYVNLALGTGYGTVTTSSGYDEVKLKGVGAAMGVTVGVPVVPNLVVHGDAVLFAISDPTVTAGGQTVRTEDAMVLTWGIGPGFTYFIQPSGVYLGASTLMSKTKLTFAGETLGRSQWGLGALARFGREFALKDTLAITLGGQYQFADQADSGGSSGTVTHHSFSVNAGLTF